MVDRPTHDPVGIVTGVLWEEAKGKLAAMVAAEGSRYGADRYDDSNDVHQAGEMKFDVMRRHFDEFIKFIEEHELHY